MAKKIKSDFYEQMELLDTLELFVQYGILKKTTKNGESAWIENEAFNRKTTEEKDAVFKQLNDAQGITVEVLQQLISSLL